MSDAKIVHGATVEWGTDGSAYTTISEARTLIVPTTEVDYIEATSLDSSGGFREYVPGLKDAGEVSVECNYTPTIYGLAEGYRTNGTQLYLRTTLPLFTGQSTTGDIFTFRAFCTPTLQQNAVGDIIMMTLAFRITGAVTYAAGS